MKSLAESPALLTVHSTAPGHYVIRVAATDQRSLVVGVSRLLGDATSLVVVTPTDTKVFTVGSNDNHTGSDEEASQTTGATFDSEEMKAVIATEESRPLPNAADDTSTEMADAIGAEVVGETAQGTKVIRRKKSPTPAAGHDEPCGRCSGEGRISMSMPDGSATETSCHICKGSGVIRRWGARR